MPTQSGPDPLVQAFTRIPRGPGVSIVLSWIGPDGRRQLVASPEAAPARWSPPEESASDLLLAEIHERSGAAAVLWKRSTSTLLAAHYWIPQGSLPLDEGPPITIQSAARPLPPLGRSGALLWEQSGLFLWSDEPLDLTRRLETTEFQIDYRLQLLSLPIPIRPQSLASRDGGWSLPPLPAGHSPSIFTL